MSLFSHHKDTKGTKSTKVSLSRKHFIDDPKVAERSGLRVGTPGDSLVWVRSEITGG